MSARVGSLTRCNTSCGGAFLDKHEKGNITGLRIREKRQGVESSGEHASEPRAENVVC